MTYKLKYLNANNREVEFSWQSGLVIGKTEGLTSNTIETALSQGFNQIGATLLGQSVQPRIINIQGTIMGDSTAGRRALLETIIPELTARLIFNDTWQIDVVPKLTPNISSEINNAAFAFILEAAFPYWYSVEETLSTLAGSEPRFKFPWNLALPWKFSERTQTFFTNVINYGNVPTPFNLIFYANTALSNPRITNVSTLEFIAVNRDMAAGETITITMTWNALSAVSSSQGIIADVFSDLDFDNTYFQLQPGDNVIRYDAEVNREGLDCRIIHRTTSIGAYI